MPRRALSPIVAIVTALTLAPASATATDDPPAHRSPIVAAAVSDALRGTLAWPVPSTTVVRAFAAPSSQWGAGHRGVDVAALPGETVVAAAAGTVTFAGVVVDRPVVTVRMDGAEQEVLVTVEPVEPVVAAGDVVEQGQVVGTLLPGHRPCGACIHLGVRIDDAYVNPMALLGAERAVLLPLGGEGTGGR